MIQRGAVDLDLGGIRFGAEIFFGDAAHGNPARLNPAAGFTARAVAEIGEQLVQAAHAQCLDRIGGIGKQDRGDYLWLGIYEAWAKNISWRQAG